jgi:hypothetical protein
MEEFSHTRQPTKFKLFINLKAANALEVVAPANLLALAVRVIRQVSRMFAIGPWRTFLVHQDLSKHHRVTFGNRKFDIHIAIKKARTAAPKVSSK